MDEISKKHCGVGIREGPELSPNHTDMVIGGMIIIFWNT